MRYLLVFLGFWLFNVAQAADLMREQRIMEQLVDGIMDGETLMLKDGDHEFLGIYMEAEISPVRGAVILLHGRGANPDWVDIIQPLRVDLPAHGWDTLSIQLPVAASEAPDADWYALISEAAPRITAAVEFLKSKQQNNVVLVAHSMGSAMALDYLSQADRPIQAVVTVGAGGAPVILGTLEKLTIPVLDMYGSQDLDGVKHAAPKRKQAARKAGNTAFSQVEIAGADHFFVGREAILTARIRSWLSRYASAVAK